MVDPSSGHRTSCAALTRDTLLGFYRRLYRPESFTLVVAGPVIPRGPRARTPGVRAAATERKPALAGGGGAALRPRRVELERPGAQAYLAIAWHAPRIDHADVAAVDLLVTILGQTRPRGFSVLRDELGIVSSI